MVRSMALRRRGCSGEEATMENNIIFIGLWLMCGIATIVAAVLAHRSRAARSVGRVAVGVLFIVGGALLHLINLASGANYSGFADPAYFPVITAAWQAVVVPNAALFIGLLAVFEVTVGVLALCGGRWTQLGYAGVIAFYLALWLFGWIETVWVLLMLAPMLLLLQAERRTALASRAEPTPTADVGS
jgi:uncharacterized membrane protein